MTMKNNTSRKETAARIRELNRVICAEQKVDLYTDVIKKDWMTDGKANSHVNVEELYHPMSLSGHRHMNLEIFDFIEQAANLLPSLVPIRLILHGVSGEDQPLVPGMIHKHYQAVMQDQIWDQRSNRYKMLLMTVIGVVFLGLYLTLALNRDDTLFLEIPSVIGSFSLWEAANCYLVERRDIKRQMRETAQFLTMEIQFEE